MRIVNRRDVVGTRPSRTPSTDSRAHHSLLAAAQSFGRRTQRAGVFLRCIAVPSAAVVAVVGAFHGSFSTQGTEPLQPVQGIPDVGEVIVEETLDPADEDVVDWAVDRFREAKLPLPTIRTSFHGDSGPCSEGAQGGHRREHGVSRVLICISELGPSRELKLKRTLLHEFAHAWDAHFLTEATRTAFMELRGLEGWSLGVPYEERGIEHAANTITWGLMDRPVLFGSFASPTPWEAQHSGYLTLTGAQPPHGYVWSLFAASHSIHAHTPAQLEAVESAWDRSEHLKRRSETIGVRFHRASETCGGEAVSSRLIEGRLHIQVCPTSTHDLPAALLQELTVEPQRDIDPTADQSDGNGPVTTRVPNTGSYGIIRDLEVRARPRSTSLPVPSPRAQSSSRGEA